MTRRTLATTSLCLSLICVHCTPDTVSEDDAWRLGDPRADMSTSGEEMDAPTSSEDMSEVRDVGMEMTPEVAPIEPPACAPDDIMLDARLLERLQEAAPDTQLIVHVTDRWPFEEVEEGEEETYPGTLMLEIETSGFEVVEPPSGYYGEEIDPYRRLPMCNVFGNRRGCPIALVKLSARELRDWISTSCVINALWASGFDCDNAPQDCEEAATCPGFDSAWSTGHGAGCMLSSVTACHDGEGLDCNAARTPTSDAQGRCWVYAGGCTPPHHLPDYHNKDCLAWEEAREPSCGR